MKYFFDDKAGAVIAVDEAGARVLPEIGGIVAGGVLSQSKGSVDRKRRSM